MGYHVCMYTFFTVKICIMSALQAMVCRRIDSEFREQVVNSSEVLALDRSSTSTELRLVYDAMLILGDFVLRLSEAIDPDSDAMTPGISKRALSKKDNRDFSDSWIDVPLVGSFVAWLGLPCVLAAGLVSVATWQVYGFCSNFVKMRCYLSRASAYPKAENFRALIYAKIFHLSDSAGLYILSKRVHYLWMAVAPAEMAAYGGDRYHSYLSRVPEMVFHGWFAVTSLTYTIDGSSDAVFAVLFSILTTLAASIKSFYEIVSIFLPWARYVSSRPWGAWHPKKLFACLVFHLLGIVTLCIRLLGVRFCDSHDFQLSTMNCRQ